MRRKSSAVKIYYKTLICEEIKSGMILCYEKDKLFLYKKGDSAHKENQEFLSYHFVNDKNRITFSYPKWKNIPDIFYITKYGFFKKEELKYLFFLEPIMYLKGIYNLIFKSIPLKIKKKLFR